MFESLEKNVKTLVLSSSYDIIDRINILISEMRHLQHNLAYALRDTKYLDMIIEEEKFLEEKLYDKVNDLRPVSEIVGEEIKETKETNDVGESPQTKNYVRDFKSIQRLKKQTVGDKLFLLRKIKELEGSINEKEFDNSQLMEIMVIRRVILVRLQYQIESLFFLHKSLSTRLDIGIQDHPRPMSLGRFDQYRNINFLNKYVSDDYKMILDLIEKSGVVIKKEKDITLEEIRKNIGHYWDYSVTSQLKLIKPMEENQERAYVASSFWMLDRPELQVSITHELTHIVLKKYFFDLEPCGHSLSGPFAKIRDKLLIKLNNYYTYQYKSESNTFRFALKYKKLAVEIMADFISTLLKGHAYLYTLFKEIVGIDFETIFPQDLTDLPIEILEAPLFIERAANISSEWYIRLHITSTILQSTQNCKKESIYYNLPRAVKRIADYTSWAYDRKS